MKAPIFGLSTCPVSETKTDLQREIDRVMLALVYRKGL